MTHRGCAVVIPITRLFARLAVCCGAEVQALREALCSLKLGKNQPIRSDKLKRETVQSWHPVNVFGKDLSRPLCFSSSLLSVCLDWTFPDEGIFLEKSYGNMYLKHVPSCFFLCLCAFYEQSSCPAEQRQRVFWFTLRSQFPVDAGEAGRKRREGTVRYNGYLQMVVLEVWPHCWLTFPKLEHSKWLWRKGKSLHLRSWNHKGISTK